ncbi:unnamed protein product, partial [Leptidea sinapis]
MSEMFPLFMVLVGFCFVSHAEGWVFNEGMVTNAKNDKKMTHLKDLKISFIYPGTKWCGTGDTASGYDDLGKEVEADKCCRDHDFCPDVITAGETKYNLTNTAYYSRLACSCDEKFLKCLEAANTKSSNSIGNVYFNVLGTKCYKKDYPITGCLEHGGWWNG